ncbi:MAG TPA: sugar ABC transporter permease [Candidatus Dormibacteraeota bacterium]|nr:sugar ABC transporter permease [Candidatus Dormibacteraeota bacterium]
MIAAPLLRRFRLSPEDRRNLRTALPFIAPWILGFLAFTVYPIVYSLYLSFTHYTGFGDATAAGFDNYQHMVKDPLFWQSLSNTLYYAGLAVPIGLVVAIALALMMNQNVREVAIYRAAFYLPSIIPLFALTFIFIVLLNPGFGLVDFLLERVGIPAVNWLGDARWTRISVVLLAQLGAGGPALIFLAALRAVPAELYESALLDGAGALRRFYKITLPLITPVILFDLIYGTILGIQIFTPAYVLTGGTSGGGAYTAGPENSLLFFVYYLYKNAFQYSDMGYASALAWVLFVISVLLALAIMRWSRYWVHYEAS